MNHSLYKVAFKHYFTRLIRDPFGLAIFTVLPILLIWLLGSIYTSNAQDEIYVQGYNMVTTHIGIGMLLLFSLNGGAYILHYLSHDFSKNMKWKLKSTPCPIHILAFASILSCTFFMFVQGLLVIAITHFFLDAYWGNLWVTLLVVLTTSIFSTLINIIFFFTTKSLTLAETISWVSAWIMAALGGLMFDLPQNAFFEFMKVYGTPFALAQTAIKSSGFVAPSVSTTILCVAILSLLNILLGIIVFYLGRRSFI
jgi:hypothetical protein